MKDQQVGHYKILEKLGAGGMGEVWLAEDTRLDRKVALKFLPHYASQNEDDKARFIQEAKAAARLSHASIAQVHEIGEEERLYIVMEYVSGGSLRDVLDDAKGKSLPLEKILTWIRQTAEGLSEAHRQGIVHRDIKPDNVMLTGSGAVKITDFGLARLETATRLTASGAALGTVNYMSPEQIAGKDVDHRCDLFSLGGMFYELLTGQQAFQGSDANATYYAILSAPIDPLHRFRKDLPEGLEAIVLKLLERDPADRYQSAAEVVTDIRRLESKEAAVQVRHPWRVLVDAMRPVLRPLALVTLGLVIGLIVTHPRPAVNDLSAHRFIPFAVESVYEGLGSWSHSGDQIAYRRIVGGESQLVVRDVDGISALPVTNRPVSPTFMPPIWSRDDNRLFFIENESIWVVGLPQSAPRLVFRGDYLYASLSPRDEDIMACWSDTDGLVIRSISDTLMQTVIPTPEGMRQPGSRPVYVRFSPDGDRIGVGYYRETREVMSPGSEDLTRGDQPAQPAANQESFPFWIFPWPWVAASQAEQPFQVNETSISRAAFDWIDNDAVLFTGYGAEPSSGWGMYRGEIRTGRLIQLSSGLDVFDDPVISPDGRRILVRNVNRHYDLIEIFLDGTTAPWSGNTQKSERFPSLSASDEYLAYLSNMRGENEIRLQSLMTGRDELLVSIGDIRGSSLERSLSTPKLSPDGRWIAFKVTRRTGGSEIWVTDTAGSINARHVLPDQAFTFGYGHYNFAWSPNSDALIVEGVDAESGVLVMVGLGNPESYRILYRGSFNFPLWLPDGDRVICSLGEEVLLIPVDGSDESQRLLSPIPDSRGGFVLMPSHDGNLLYFISTRDADHGIYTLDLNTGSREKIADLDPALILGVGISYLNSGTLRPDGKSFLTTISISSSDLMILDGILPH